VLRVNFVSGAEESSGFRFVGSEGIMTVGGTVKLSKQPPEKGPGYSIDTFTKAMQTRIKTDYETKYPPAPHTPEGMNANVETVFRAPHGYSDHYDHHLNFARAIRSRKPIVEDAVFGLRAAGPALLSNMSYFEGHPVEWDPIAMKLKA
jgi:hypothetical protein